MNKKIFLVFTASVSYFIIYILLKFFLQNKILDWESGLLGSITFGFIVFLVHDFFVWSKPVQ